MFIQRTLVSRQDSCSATWDPCRAADIDICYRLCDTGSACSSTHLFMWIHTDRDTQKQSWYHIIPWLKTSPRTFPLMSNSPYDGWKWAEAEMNDDRPSPIPSALRSRSPAGYWATLVTKVSLTFSSRHKSLKNDTLGGKMNMNKLKWQLRQWRDALAPSGTWVSYLSWCSSKHLTRSLGIITFQKQPAINTSYEWLCVALHSSASLVICSHWECAHVIP